jgi:hypothetical protein
MTTYAYRERILDASKFIVVAASHRYVIDTSSEARALDRSLFNFGGAGARATDFCHMTSPWQHIMSMRII